MTAAYGDSSAVAIIVAHGSISRARYHVNVRARVGMAAEERSSFTLGPQTMIYFGVSGGALLLALTLLYTRYVRRDPQAVQSGGGFAYFAIFMLLFALGAAIAGYASWQAGR